VKVLLPDADISYVDTLTLGSAIVAFKDAQTATQIQYAVAARLMSAARAQGQAVVEMLDEAAEGFERATAEMIAASGTPGTLDIYA